MQSIKLLAVFTDKIGDSFVGETDSAKLFAPICL